MIGCRVEPNKRWPRVTVIQFKISINIDITWSQTTILKTISELSLCNWSHRLYMQCRLHPRVNHAGTDVDVSFPLSGLSHLWIYWGSICCISYYYFGWSLLIYHESSVSLSLGTPPPSWPCRLSQQWGGFHNLISPPPLVPWKLCQYHLFWFVL